MSPQTQVALTAEADNAYITHRKYAHCQDPGDFCSFFKGWWSVALSHKPYLAPHGDDFRALVEARLKGKSW